MAAKRRPAAVILKNNQGILKCNFVSIDFLTEMTKLATGRRLQLLFFFNVSPVGKTSLQTVNIQADISISELRLSNKWTN